MMVCVPIGNTVHVQRLHACSVNTEQNVRNSMLDSMRSGIVFASYFIFPCKINRNFSAMFNVRFYYLNTKPITERKFVLNWESKRKVYAIKKIFFKSKNMVFTFEK